jgi:hypothetical protein
MVVDFYLPTAKQARIAALKRFIVLKRLLFSKLLANHA